MLALSCSRMSTHFKNGFQSFPVVFPVDGLAQSFMHQFVYNEEPVIFLLGNKRPTGFFGIDVEDEGVQQAEMVAHQEEAPFLGQLLQASGMNF